MVTTAFVTDEGAFLRGQIRMEETVDLDLEASSESTTLDFTRTEPASDNALPASAPVDTSRLAAQKKK